MPASPFDAAYTASWDAACVTPGLFRNAAYATLTQRRPLGSATGAIVQFNPEHLKTKRQTSFMSAAAAPRVCTPVDPSAFNFTKAAPAEALLALSERGACHCPQHCRSGGGALHPSLEWAASHAPGGDGAHAAAARASVPHWVYANISPIFGYAGLLIPYARDVQPQLLTERMVRVALGVARLSARPDFRLGYNSMGAWASVNHFHWQAAYIDDCFPDQRSFPVERAAREAVVGAASPTAPAATCSMMIACCPDDGELAAAPVGTAAPTASADGPAPALTDGGAEGGGAASLPTCSAPPSHSPDSSAISRPGRDGAAAGVTSSVVLSELTGWPLGGFCFSVPPLIEQRDFGAVTSDPTSCCGCCCSLDHLAAAVGVVADHLTSSDIAHNLLISRSSVYVLPRQHQRGGGANEGVMAVAFAEACGIAVVYSQAAFDAMREAEYAATLTQFRLPDTLMAGVRAACVAGVAAANARRCACMEGAAR